MYMVLAFVSGSDCSFWQAHVSEGGTGLAWRMVECVDGLESGTIRDATVREALVIGRRIHGVGILGLQGWQIDMSGLVCRFSNAESNTA